MGPDGRTRRDWWGAGHDAEEEGYFIRESPLATNADLDAFTWPDPSAAGLLDDAARLRERTGEDGFVVPNLGFALFERAWSLRGFEQLLFDLAADPAYVAELLDRITEIQLVLIERYLDLGVDGGYFGDDYGAQAGLLFSPATWRSLVKPRLARLFAPFVDRGLPVLMHSDGRIDEIVPDLRGDRPDGPQPGPAGGPRSRLAARHVRRAPGLLRRALHPDGAAPWHDRRGP